MRQISLITCATSLRSIVGHRKAPEEPKDRFVREIRLTGDLSEDQKKRLLEIADKCLHRTLHGSGVETALDTGEPMPQVDNPTEHGTEASKDLEDVG